MLRNVVLTRLYDDRVSVYTSRYDFVCYVSLCKLLTFITPHQKRRVKKMKSHDELKFRISESVITKCEEQ